MPGVCAAVQVPTAEVSNARAATPKQRLEPVCQLTTTVLLWMRRAVSTQAQPARCRNVWDMFGQTRMIVQMAIHVIPVERPVAVVPMAVTAARLFRTTMIRSRVVPMVHGVVQAAALLL